MTELEKLLIQISDNERCKDLDIAFAEVATELIQNSILVAGDSQYFIKEIEFYFSSEQHQDPYVHKHPRQLEFGEWYFHRLNMIKGYSPNYRFKGVDLTFGNEEKCNFGGILIRGLWKCNTNSKPKNGSSNTVSEIMNSIANADSVANAEIICLAKTSEKSVFNRNDSLYIKENLTTIERKKLLKSKRQLPTIQINDTDGYYYNKKYRFFDDFEYIKLMTGKEKIVKQLYDSKQICFKDAMEISGRRENFFTNDL